MDFEPYFKVHNLVSVDPKSIILGQMTNLDMIFYAVKTRTSSLLNFGTAIGKGTPLILTAGKPSIKRFSSNLSVGLELRISLPVSAKHSLTCLNKAAEEIRNRRS